MHTLTQKITAHLPKHLLHEAQAITGKGITETLKAGLEELAKKKAYENLLKLKGAYHFSIDLNELRKDRNEK